MKRVVDYKVAAKVLSRNLFVLEAALLLSGTVSCFFSEPAKPFWISAAITAFIAGIFQVLSGRKRENLMVEKREAHLTVTISWVLLSVLGCLPYVLSGSIPSFVDALFESVSGFTTTGSSILENIEALPKSILFWRSLTHWIGGIGIIVLVIVIMPTLQVGGYNLFTLESSLQDKIKPKIKSVGFRILFIYLILTVLEIIFLYAGKMNLFESASHAFGTIATGGFSPKNTSVAGYSPYIQYVIMGFMLLSGTNFIIHYYLLKRDFRKIKENDEVKFYLKVVLILGLIITAFLFFKMKKPLAVCFREAFFQVISIVTTTGFATTDYLNWPRYAWILIFFAMFLGGSTGSTAGGVKMARYMLLLQNVKKYFKQMVYPKAVLQIRLNGQIIKKEQNSSMLTFISLYFLFFILGSLLLVMMGIDGKTASSSVATCLAGIGPGIGSVGPADNFSHFPQLAKMFLSFIMIIGRLEIFTVIILFSPSFWRK